VANGYAGADRRQPLTAEIPAAFQRRVYATTGVAIVLCCLLAAICATLAPALVTVLSSDARGCAAALFLIAGTLRMARWRLTGEAPMAYSASALIVLGGCTTVLSFFGPVLQSANLPSAPAVKIVILAPVFGLILASRRSPPVRSGMRPATLALGCILACSMVLLVLAVVPDHRIMNSGTFWMAAECCAAWIWALLAAATCGHGRRSARPTLCWSGIAMYLMAASEALRGISILVPGSLLTQAAGLALVAAGLMVAASATELGQIYAAHGTRQISLSGGLDAAARQLRLAEQKQLERLHDARSAVVGVLGASQLLTGPAAAAGQQPLHQLMVAELNRLNRVLDPDQTDPIEDFWLGSVLEPVLLAHRLSGAGVDIGNLELAVHGRPNATATVLANLLSNARLHAPGCRVRVAAARSGAAVTITVDDDGPGMPVVELDRVLQRGLRGSTVQAAGSGLGLYTASLAMTSQGGSLRLAQSPSGGVRVLLELPAALGSVTSQELRAC
jgi:signal transduction histidine kinase